MIEETKPAEDGAPHVDKDPITIQRFPGPEMHLMNRHDELEKAVPVAIRTGTNAGDKVLQFMVPASDVDTVMKALEDIIEPRAATPDEIKEITENALERWF